MSIRAANNGDVPAIQSLIDRSARELSIGYYTPEQIDAAVMHVFGVDSQLIADRSYYVIEIDDAIVAAGGWSARRTLYGGDQMKDIEDPRLDPLNEPARIRAFFVHPAWARRGLARQLYNECARAALAAGFSRFELMATAPGVPAYISLGFTIVERIDTPLPGGVSVPFARMARVIQQHPDTHGASLALTGVMQDTSGDTTSEQDASDDETNRLDPESQREFRERVTKLVFGGDENKYNEFVRTLSDATPDGVEVILRGSAVMGHKWHHPEEPFDHDGPGTSDMDVTFVGGDMVMLFRDFHIPGIHSAPLSEAHPFAAPSLGPLRQKLCEMAGRPVNLQATTSLVQNVRDVVMDQPYLVLLDKRDVEKSNDD